MNSLGIKFKDIFNAFWAITRTQVHPHIRKFNLQTLSEMNKLICLPSCLWECLYERVHTDDGNSVDTIQHFGRGEKLQILQLLLGWTVRTVHGIDRSKAGLISGT
jgi:hypothetical protein